MFGLGKLLGGKAKEAVNQFSGNKDFLEALCAGSALVAAADGQIDDDEYDTALDVIKNNTAISAAFGTGEIESVFGKMAPKTKTRSGKAELKEEIKQCIARDKTQAMGNALIYVMLDVADNGGISPEEEKVMREIAGLAGVNYDKLAA